jgi:hypothetical protein
VHLGLDPAAPELDVTDDALVGPEQKRPPPEGFLEGLLPAPERRDPDLLARQRARWSEVRRAVVPRLGHVINKVAGERVHVVLIGAGEAD